MPEEAACREEWLEELSRHLTGYLRLRCPDHFEEIRQEVFKRLFKEDKLRRSTSRTFVFRRADWLLARYMKKENRYIDLASLDQANREYEDRVLFRLMAEERKDSVLREAQKLPNREQEVFMSRWGGKAHKVTAAELGISEMAVRRAWSTACRKIREQVSNMDDQQE